MTRSVRLAFVGALLIVSGCGGASEEDQSDSDQITIHPITSEPFMCSEHAEGEAMEPHLGNALGRDCMIVGAMEREDDRRVVSIFEQDGLENEDYFGWNVPVLAPAEGVVSRVQDPPERNVPGLLPEDPGDAGTIEFRTRNGDHVIYVHVREIQVREGVSVSAGETVARIGNNGSSRAPHVHIGAWRGETPLQIRFDLAALGALRGLN